MGVIPGRKHAAWTIHNSRKNLLLRPTPSSFTSPTPVPDGASSAGLAAALSLMSPHASPHKFVGDEDLHLIICGVEKQDHPFSFQLPVSLFASPPQHAVQDHETRNRSKGATAHGRLFREILELSKVNSNTNRKLINRKFCLIPSRTRKTTVTPNNFVFQLQFARFHCPRAQSLIKKVPKGGIVTEVKLKSRNTRTCMLSATISSLLHISL